MTCALSVLAVIYQHKDDGLVFGALELQLREAAEVHDGEKFYYLATECNQEETVTNLQRLATIWGFEIAEAEI